MPVRESGNVRVAANASDTIISTFLVFFIFLWYYLNVRIFKYKWFHRFAGKEGITDNELKEIVKQLENGQYYADLGGGVYKMRLARQQEGKKSGNYRLIVIFKSEFRTFFAYGFSKSKMSNVEGNELKGFKKQAKEYLSLTEEQIKSMLKIKDLIEI